MNDSEARYDRLVIDSAELWFSHCGNLLVWDWDHDVPGPCHPALVAHSHENGMPFPASVKRRDSGFFPTLLCAEWKRAGAIESVMPVPEPVPDTAGRMAWLFDLGKASEDTRCFIGRACMRELCLPAWDFELRNLAFAGASKTSVIHVGDFGHICEPTPGDLVEVLEAMRPGDPESASFTLVHPGRSYFSVLMTTDGCIVQTRIWRDARGMIFRHFQACMGESPKTNRTLRNGLPVGDENHLPWISAMSLALAFLAAPGALPKMSGIIWHDISGEFSI